MTATAIGLVEQIVQGTGQLYSLPVVAAEVLRLTGEPRIDPRRVKECLERDPALTARILKAVNSSLFGLSRQVTDLSQALSLLGTRPLRMLVLGFSLPKALFAGLEAEVLARYWRHSLIKAVAARELAEKVWQIPGDEAFTAGLIQDIGVLALCQQVGPTYLKFLDHVQTHGGNLIDRELDSLGFDHAVLTARLLSHWGLPAPLCAALAVPPDERSVAALEPAERTLPQILHLAELLARLVEQPYGPALHELLAVGGHYCGLTYDRLRPIGVVLQAKVQELAEALDLNLPGDDSYIDLLLAAHTRLAEASLTNTVLLESAAQEDDLLALTAELQAEVAGLDRRAGGVSLSVSAQPQLSYQEADASRLSGAIHTNPTRQRGMLSDAPLKRCATPSEILPSSPDDPALLGQLAAAINRCRQARCGLTLALVEIDDHRDLMLELGPQGLSDLLHQLRVALGDWSGQRGPAVAVSDGLFALLFENCSRSEALTLIRQVLEQIKTYPLLSDASQKRSTGPQRELTASAGLATLALPSKNFPAQQLLDGARRCLTGAQLSGGNSFKSIEF